MRQREKDDKITKALEEGRVTSSTLLKTPDGATKISLDASLSVLFARFSQ